ncbi:hypothetical protein [Paraglaciecola arctica]|uniref:hypothetical protein n=1 Tax=Paraglaciecola arctica TaxID=1128911 RepID=UPI001C07796D|nr:hypothetical protein [Paraglaciecola arctica]MBU3002106.1 hypothetical protein [Paraglaciecola arctica]
MKKLTLNHSYTPTPLKSINQRLSELTTENDPDESNFLKLAIERDEFIQDYIKNLPDDEKREFVTAELQVNGALVAYAEESFKASLKQLTGLIRGRKAVKKYR